MKKNIFLCGFMGAGKSTVGRHFAEKLAVLFYDTDSMVVKSAGASVAELFAKSEEAFRQIESNEILKLEGMPPGVVALGGGALKDRGNLQCVRRNGILVYLEATPATLHARLQLGEVEIRPMLAGLASDARLKKIEDLLAVRALIYSSADITIVTDGKSPEKICEEILAELKRGRFE